VNRKGGALTSRRPRGSNRNEHPGL
jgi:hypothetical protein